MINNHKKIGVDPWRHRRYTPGTTLLSCKAMIHNEFKNFKTKDWCKSENKSENSRKTNSVYILKIKMKQEVLLELQWINKN